MGDLTFATRRDLLFCGKKKAKAADLGSFSLGDNKLGWFPTWWLLPVPMKQDIRLSAERRRQRGERKQVFAERDVLK